MVKATTDELIGNAIRRTKSVYSSCNTVVTRSSLEWMHLYQAREFLRDSRKPATDLITAKAQADALGPGDPGYVDFQTIFNAQVRANVPIEATFNAVEPLAITYYQKLEALFDSFNTRISSGTGLTFEVNEKVYDSVELTDVKAAAQAIVTQLADFA